MEGLHQIENAPEIAAVEGEKVVVMKGKQSVGEMQVTVENSTETAAMAKEKEEQLSLEVHPSEETIGGKKSVSALTVNFKTAELGSAPAKKRVRFEEREESATENLNCTTVEASAAQGEVINYYAPLTEVGTNGQSWCLEDTVKRAGHLDDVPEATDLRVEVFDNEKRVEVKSDEAGTSGLQGLLEVFKYFM